MLMEVGQMIRRTFSNVSKIHDPSLIQVPHMTPFHNSMLMEVGQMLWRTFSNVSKTYDPSPVRVQKCNRRKYDTQTKLVSYDTAHIG